MIDGSEKRNRQLAFELQNSHVCEKRSNQYGSAMKPVGNKEYGKPVARTRCQSLLMQIMIATSCRAYSMKIVVYTLHISHNVPYFPSPPPPKKNNWHKHCFQFLLGRL